MPCLPAWAASGDVLWEQRAPTSASCPEPVGLGGLVFTYTTDGKRRGSPYPILRAYDALSGSPVWEAREPLGYHGFAFRGNGLAAARGRVFTVAARWTEHDASSVTARDAATGALLWRLQLEDPRIQYRVYTIAAADDEVFLLGRRQPEASAIPGRDWSEVMLLAVEARSGALLWSDFFNLAGGPDEGYSVVAGRGRVVISVADLEHHYPVGYRGPSTALRAYDAATGALLWQDATDAVAPVQLALDRNRVFSLGYTRQERATLVAYALASGRRLWEEETHQLFAHWVTAARRTVAIYGGPPFRSGTNAGIRVYDAATGRLLWRRNEARVQEGQQILAHRGRLFSIGALEHPGGFFVSSYRLRSGRPRWSYRLDDPEEFGCRLVVERNVVVATSTGFPGEIVRAFVP